VQAPRNFLFSSDEQSPPCGFYSGNASFPEPFRFLRCDESHCFFNNKKSEEPESPSPVFLIKPPSVALEKFGEWVCACRSSSAFFRRSAALWLRQHPMQNNNCQAVIPLYLLPVLPPFAATKAVLTKKYRLYYKQKSTTCQLERIGY